MATTEVKNAIALKVASGIAPAQIERQHGYSKGGLRVLLSQPEMKALVKEQQEILSLKAQQLVAKVWIEADGAIDRIIQLSRDSSKKEYYDANKYLVERVWPTKSVAEQEVHVHFDADLSRQVVEGLEHFRGLRARSQTTIDVTPLEDDPHLHDGQDVAFYERPSAMDAEPLPDLPLPAEDHEPLHHSDPSPGDPAGPGDDAGR